MKRIDYLLILVIILAAVVRYWGITFGLPDTMARPDENIIVQDTFLLPGHMFHPGSLMYPSFYKYILFCLYCLYFLFGVLRGTYTSTADFAAEFYIAPANFYLITRCLSAFLGTATVYVVYKIVERLFDRRAALLSSLFLCLSHLHVRDSHFGVTDISMTFFLMCAIFFITKCYLSKQSKPYLLAGIFSGLALSTKWAGLLSVIPMFIVHCFNLSREKSRMIRIFTDTRILLFLTACILAFLVGTPFFIIDFKGFIAQMQEETGRLHSGLGPILGRGWWYHLKFSLLYGLGWPLLISSLAGIVMLFRRDIKKALIICSCPLIYYLIMGRWLSVLIRYSIPLVPFLCITAGVFWVFIVDKIIGRGRPVANNAVFLLIGAMVMIPSINDIIKSDRLLAMMDNRVIAQRWISEHVPAQTSIYQTGYPGLNLPLRSSSVLPVLEGIYGTSGISDKDARFLKARIDYLKNKKYIRYKLWDYDSDSGSFSFENNSENTIPDYIITKTSPLIRFDQGVPKKIKNLCPGLKESHVPAPTSSFIKEKPSRVS